MQIACSLKGGIGTLPLLGIYFDGPLVVPGWINVLGWFLMRHVLSPGLAIGMMSHSLRKLSIANNRICGV